MEAATILSSSLQVLDLAGNIYNNHNKIKWLFNYCRKSVKVLIVGESGSGKSQFLSTIQENKEFSESRTLVSHKSTLVLPNGRRVDFYDTPGHQTLKQERTKIINEISRKKFNGIVNIVCCGYQAVEGAKASEIFQGEEVKEAFLKENRAKELKQIQEWMPHIDKNSRVEWVLTIVNKADIWWERGVDAISQYADNSQYDNELRSLARVADVAIVPYCSLINPLFLGKSIKLSFGEKEKYALHVNLCKQLGELTGIEWRK